MQKNNMTKAVGYIRRHQSPPPHCFMPSITAAAETLFV